MFFFTNSEYFALGMKRMAMAKQNSLDDYQPDLDDGDDDFEDTPDQSGIDVYLKFQFVGCRRPRRSSSHTAWIGI